MSIDIGFNYFRNFRFDGKLHVRCLGKDLGKVDKVHYVLRRVDPQGPKRLADQTVQSHVRSGKLADLGCPAVFTVTQLSGQYSITPRVTLTQAAGGGEQSFAPLVLVIGEEEASRSILDKVPLGGFITRAKRSVESAEQVGTGRATSFDSLLGGHPAINLQPALPPLVVEFSAGGFEQFQHDLQPESRSLLVRRWPGIGRLIVARPYHPGGDLPAALKCFYLIEHLPSLLNDTYLALGNTLAALDYVESVQLEPTLVEGFSLLQSIEKLRHYNVMFELGLMLGNRLFPTATAEAPTPDFGALQTYLDAPGSTKRGLNIRKAWAKQVTGKGVRVHLVDGGLFAQHEDLRHNPDLHVVELGNNDDPRHGTASTGILVANPGKLGITGICHASEVRVHHARAENAQGELRVLRALHEQVAAGDIVVIPQQLRDHDLPGTNLPFVHNKMFWTHLKLLAEKGAVIVCAAGNGHEKDDARSGAKKATGVDLSAGRFHIDHGEANVILVGACDSVTGKAHTASNHHYPYRMLNAWGDGVVTLGFGDLQDKPGNDRDYTARYNGTSSATPLVAGALCLIQSYAMQQHHLYLDVNQLHLLVMQAGYEEATSPGSDVLPMGARPNVEGALVLLDRILGGGRFHSPKKEL